MWTLAHQPPRTAQRKTLRIITDEAATIHWSNDEWVTANDLDMRDAEFGCWFGDVPSDRLEASAGIVFTFLWRGRWEGKDFQVAIY